MAKQLAVSKDRLNDIEQNRKYYEAHKNLTKQVKIAHDKMQDRVKALEKLDDSYLIFMERAVNRYGADADLQGMKERYERRRQKIAPQAMNPLDELVFFANSFVDDHLFPNRETKNRMLPDGQIVEEPSDLRDTFLEKYDPFTVVSMEDGPADYTQDCVIAMEDCYAWEQVWHRRERARIDRTEKRAEIAVKEGRIMPRVYYEYPYLFTYLPEVDGRPYPDCMYSPSMYNGLMEKERQIQASL